MLRLSRRLLALLFALGFHLAHATLVEQGTYFTDSTTSLDWLTNSPLAGQSYDSILGGYGGYTTSGWRLATGPELFNLVNSNVGIGAIGAGPLNSYFNYEPSAQVPASILIALLGINVAFGNPPDPRSTAQLLSNDLFGIATQGVYDDQTGGARVGLFDFAAYFRPNGSPTYEVLTQINPDNNLAEDFHGMNVSAILVRDAAARVPEPGTLALIALGLAGLGWSRRK